MARGSQGSQPTDGSLGGLLLYNSVLVSPHEKYPYICSTIVKQSSIVLRCLVVFSSNVSMAIQQAEVAQSSLS